MEVMNKQTSRVSLLTQAFTLWLMDMASLPPAYINTPEFRAAYQEYYHRFTDDIRKAQVTSLSIGERGRDANGKVTPYPTSSVMNEEVGEDITPLETVYFEYDSFVGGIAWNQ